MTAERKGDDVQGEDVQGEDVRERSFAEGAPPPAVAGLPPGLELSDVCLERGGFRLGPISLEVRRGEQLFLHGTNGSGKSSLLLAIAGLIPVRSGRISVTGHIVSAGGVERVVPHARESSLLLQDLGLWPHLSIGAQCRLVARGGKLLAHSPGVEIRHRAGRPDLPATADARIEALAILLEVTPFLDRRPAELSGGEAQRCALLRALAPGTPLLLLDEPFAAQHANGAACVERAIAGELARGVAVVTAGHRAPSGARRWELGVGGECIAR